MSRKVGFRVENARPGATEVGAHRKEACAEAANQLLKLFGACGIFSGARIALLKITMRLWCSCVTQFCMPAQNYEPFCTLINPGDPSLYIVTVTILGPKGYVFPTPGCSDACVMIFSVLNNWGTYSPVFFWLFGCLGNVLRCSKFFYALNPKP